MLPAYQVNANPFGDSMRYAGESVRNALMAYGQQREKDNLRMGQIAGLKRTPGIDPDQAESLAADPVLARNVLMQYSDPMLGVRRKQAEAELSMVPLKRQQMQNDIDMNPLQRDQLSSQIASSRATTDHARAMSPYQLQQARIQAQTAERDFNAPKPNTFDLGPDHTRFEQRRNPDGSVTAVPVASGGQQGGKTPPGYRMSPDGQAMQAIPGGPADIKTNEKRQQDFNSMQYMFQKLDDLGTQANIVKTHPGLEGITGIQGKLPNFPGSNAANAEAERTTLLSKSAFAALQDMRNASKTGGALGAIAVQELVMLQNATVALEKSQDAKQYRTNLDRMQKQIEQSKQRIAAAYNDHWNNGGVATRQTAVPTAVPTATPPVTGKDINQPPKPKTEAEMRGLPSGTIYEAPDGSMRQVP